MRRLLAFIVLALSVSSICMAQSKVQNLTDAYKENVRLSIVTNENREGTVKCPAVAVGYFGTYTNLKCLKNFSQRDISSQRDASLYSSYGLKNLKLRPKLLYKRVYNNEADFIKSINNGFNTDSWALIETYDGSKYIADFESLDDIIGPETVSVDLIGYSSKFKGGKEVGLQRGCHFARQSKGVYTSDCGKEFDVNGFLMFRSGGSEKEKELVFLGLGSLQSSEPAGKKYVNTLKVFTNRDSETSFDIVTRNQERRWAAYVREMEETNARYDAEHPPEPEARKPSTIEVISGVIETATAALNNTKPPSPTTAAPQRGPVSRSKCSILSVSPHVLHVPAEGGTYYVEIKPDDPDCEWELKPWRGSENSKSWMLVGLDSGIGPARVAVVISALGKDDGRYAALGQAGQYIGCPILHVMQSRTGEFPNPACR